MSRGLRVSGNRNSRDPLLKMSDDASKPGAGDAPSSPPSDNAGGDSGSGSGSSGFSAERMSPSERAAIRQRLLERQRAAARGNGTSAPTPATTGTGSTPAPSAAPAGPTYSAETGTTVPPRAPSGIPAWQLQDANTLLNKPGIPSASEVPAVTASETPSTPAPAPEGPPLRENMVAQAVSFLSSPKVQSSPKDRQDSFLKTKGVTDAEIAEARRRVAGGAPTSSPSSPSVSTPAGAAPAATPGTYTGATASSEALAAKLQAQQSQQSAQARIAAEQAAREAQQKAMEAFEEAKKKREEALARRKMQDYIMLAMILGGGAFGVLRAIKVRMARVNIVGTVPDADFFL